ncbi:MAG: DUF3617 family protein [Sphingopyxis sp.]|nr:DUF3617 family protein [Sphingopyxis sp.]
MRVSAFLIGVAALSLSACSDNAGGMFGGDSAPVKRQAGSWTTKVEVIKLAGPEVKAGEKEQLQAMMDAVGGVSVCLTPEAAAAEDMIKNLERMGSQGGECTFGDRKISGSTINFDATCKSPDGGSAKMSASGTNDTTSQDFTMTTVATKPDGKPAGELVIRFTGQRTGECKPGDFTPPMPPKAEGATKS